MSHAHSHSHATPGEIPPKLLERLLLLQQENTILTKQVAALSEGLSWRSLWIITFSLLCIVTFTSVPNPKHLEDYMADKAAETSSFLRALLQPQAWGRGKVLQVRSFGVANIAWVRETTPERHIWALLGMWGVWLPLPSSVATATGAIAIFITLVSLVNAVVGNTVATTSLRLTPSNWRKPLPLLLAPFSVAGLGGLVSGLLGLAPTGLQLEEKVGAVHVFMVYLLLASVTAMVALTLLRYHHMGLEGNKDGAVYGYGVPGGVLGVQTLLVLYSLRDKQHTLESLVMGAEGTTPLQYMLYYLVIEAVSAPSPHTLLIPVSGIFFGVLLYYSMIAFGRSA